MLYVPTDAEITFADHADRLYARRYGMAPVVGRLLGYLAICDQREQSIADLAEALLASRSAIAGAVKTLEQLGLVRRTRAAGERMDRVGIDLTSPRAFGFDPAEYQERGVHVSPVSMFTFRSDILVSRGACGPVPGLRACAGAWFCRWSCVRACSRLLVAAVLAGGDGRGLLLAVAGQGGPAARPARVLRRRLRVFGGRPTAARRWFSSCRAVQAVRVLRRRRHGAGPTPAAPAPNAASPPPRTPPATTSPAAGAA